MASAMVLEASPALAENSPGRLDETFGVSSQDGTPTGVVWTALGEGNEFAEDLAIDTDGAITVVGNRFNGENSDIVVVRYDPDGGLDSSFGPATEGAAPAGTVNISLGEGHDFASAVALQADGKIVVVGYHDEGKSTDMFALRLNKDGSLDQSFGTSDAGTEIGVVNISIGDGDDVARDVAIQPDGKVVIVGDGVSADGSTQLAIVRLHADGSIDEGFGQAENFNLHGFVSTKLGPGDEMAEAVALDAEGNIVVAGSHVTEDGTSNILVARYTASGEPDPTFGGSNEDGTPAGFVSASLGEGDDIARDVAIQPDGKIVLVGESTMSADQSSAMIARLNSDGTPDEAFGDGEDGARKGVVLSTLGKGSAYATAVAARTGGHIVVAGYKQDGDDMHMLVARFGASGELDQFFGKAGNTSGTGFVSISLGEARDKASSVGIQGDGSIIVAGTAKAIHGNRKITLLRLTAD